MADIRYNDINTIQRRLDTRLVPVDFGPDAKKNIKTLAEVIHRIVCLKERTWYRRDAKNFTRQNHGQRRSAEDVYQVGKRYVKDLTLEKVSRALEAIESNRLIYSNYCGAVCRRVYSNNSCVSIPTLAQIKQIVKI